MAGAIVVNELVKNYGSVHAVRGVSFEVGEGEIFGLLGPNGAGKTSTVECVIGLRAPDGGSISICGIDALADPNGVKQRIGAQLQSTALQDKITPREAIRLFGSFYAHRAPTHALLERFALSDKADAYFDTLSGGQRQRLALALAFVNEPRVLFLDEPTTGLDPQSRRELHGSIRQMRADGCTILLTTHYIEEAHQLCDRIAIVDQGKVIAAGRPEELIAASATRPRIAFRPGRPIDRAELLALPAAVAAEGDGEVRLQTANLNQTLIELVKLLDAQGIELVDLHIERPSLEDVFIELTGTRLRE